LIVWIQARARARGHGQHEVVAVDRERLERRERPARIERRPERVARVLQALVPPRELDVDPGHAPGTTRGHASSDDSQP